MIRLLLVDDQPAVRRGLQMRLALEADLQVIGEAGDGEAGLALAQRLMPDVVLMDIEMPCLDGIAATARLRESCARASVIILSLYDDAATCMRAGESGAAAVVGKQESMDVLLNAIRQAAATHRS